MTGVQTCALPICMKGFVKGMALGMVAGAAADMALRTAKGKRTKAGKTMQAVTDVVDNAAASVKHTLGRSGRRSEPGGQSAPAGLLGVCGGRQKIRRDLENFLLTSSCKSCIIILAVEPLAPRQHIMQQYRRGHNEHDWKSCDGQKPSEGSNPSCCASKALETLSF